jgi:hypothetical protein
MANAARQTRLFRKERHAPRRFDKCELMAMMETRHSTQCNIGGSFEKRSPLAGTPNVLKSILEQNKQQQKKVRK